MRALSIVLVFATSACVADSDPDAPSDPGGKADEPTPAPPDPFADDPCPGEHLASPHEGDLGLYRFQVRERTCELGVCGDWEPIALSPDMEKSLSGIASVSVFPVTLPGMSLILDTKETTDFFGNSCKSDFCDITDEGVECFEHTSCGTIVSLFGGVTIHGTRRLNLDGKLTESCLTMRGAMNQIDPDTGVKTEREGAFVLFY